jgi:hypothetical protein
MSFLRSGWTGEEGICITLILDEQGIEKLLYVLGNACLEPITDGFSRVRRLFKKA